jgi:hypothetical protein
VSVQFSSAAVTAYCCTLHDSNVLHSYNSRNYNAAICIQLLSIEQCLSLRLQCDTAIKYRSSSIHTSAAVKLLHTHIRMVRVDVNGRLKLRADCDITIGEPLAPEDNIQSWEGLKRVHIRTFTCTL